MNWFEILTETTQHVKDTINPLMDTPLAKKTYGIGAGGDLKKHIDLQAEKSIISTLLEHNIEFTLISEESGIKKFGEKPSHYVTIDPIDGTTNTIRGIPFACTSIAISKSPELDTIEAAAVADIFRDTLYLAQKKRGSYKNGETINPANTTNLDKAIVGIDLNTYQIKKLTKQLNSLLINTKHIRHLGANALELCYIADGTIDVFIDLRGKLRTTDVAAASLIIKEAGATITTPQNEHLKKTLSPTETVAFIASGNKKLHKDVLNLLKKA